MGQLDREIATYERMREDLEADHPLEWVIIHNEELIGTYPDFPEAAERAVKRFGREGCLLRQIGKPPVTVPASIPARPDSAQEVEREPGLLDTEIATYNRMQEYLEANHKGEWAVIHGEELIGTYTDFQEAAKISVKRFGRGPCLVREIGAPPLVLPPYILERQIRPRETETGQPGPLDTEIATYNRMREYLEANHHWEWVVIHGEELIGTYTDFQVAAKTAVKRFGRGPFLLRQVAWPPARLPASVWTRRVYDQEVEMGKLDVEIATYEGMQEHLEANHKGEWAVIHGEEFVGTYPDFQVAADAAVRRFGRGPYLIREIGAPPIIIPSYILERQGYAHR